MSFTYARIRSNLKVSAASFRKAPRKASALRQRHDALKGTFDLAFAKMIGPDGLKQRAGVFEGATLWKVWFGRAFRSANRDYRRIAPRSQKVAHDAIARNLRALADHFGERTQFERDAAYRDALGVNFQGIESGWDAMQRLAAWYEEVFTLLPEQDEETKALRSILLVTRVDRLRDTRARLDTFARERAILERLPESISMVARALPLPVSLSMPVAEILASLRQFNGQVEEVLALLHRIDLKEAVALDCIPDLIRESESYRGSADRIDSDLQMKELLGSHFVGMGNGIGADQAHRRIRRGRGELRANTSDGRLDSLRSLRRPDRTIARLAARSRAVRGETGEHRRGYRRHRIIDPLEDPVAAVRGAATEDGTCPGQPERAVGLD